MDRRLTSPRRGSPALFKQILDQKRMTPIDGAATIGFSSRGLKQRHSLSAAMGVRETDELLSKLRKENFDLRLNFAKKHEILQKKAEKVDELETVVSDLKEQVERLQRALDERDEALSYAAGLVMEKEQEIAEILASIGRSEHKPAEPEESKGMLNTSTPNTLESNCERNSDEDDSSINYSFLAQIQTPSRPRLNDPVLSPKTPFLNSPCLSALSESSFQSIYETCDYESETGDDCSASFSPIRNPIFNKLRAEIASSPKQETRSFKRRQDMKLSRYQSPLKFSREVNTPARRRTTSFINTRDRRGETLQKSTKVKTARQNEKPGSTVVANTRGATRAQRESIDSSSSGRNTFKDPHKNMARPQPRGRRLAGVLTPSIRPNTSTLKAQDNNPGPLLPKDGNSTRGNTKEPSKGTSENTARNKKGLTTKALLPSPPPSTLKNALSSAGDGKENCLPTPASKVRQAIRKFNGKTEAQNENPVSKRNPASLRGQSAGTTARESAKKKPSQDNLKAAEAK